ncbi:MAG: hypothetical protein WBQ94_15240 [Terracidiphilus sp.]
MGLTVVEPLADVDVNVPGVMEMLVAPVVVQLSVLLALETMVVGFAEKDVIASAGESGLTQPASPTEINRIRPIA